MKHHLLLRNLSRHAARFLQPSGAAPARPQTLGTTTTTNNIQRPGLTQTQRQPFHFHFTFNPRLPLPSIPQTSNFPPIRHTSTQIPVNNMPPKRKSTHAEAEPKPQPEQATRRRSSRLSKGVELKEEVEAPVKEEKPKSVDAGKTGKKGGRKPAAAAVVKEEEENEVMEGTEGKVEEQPPTKRSRTTTKTKADTKATTKPPPTASSSSTTTPSSSRNYWLLKAEPLPRLENGHDVHFSIDDLRLRTSPEPWDGIRNYSARNNLRSMRRGDLAFFYHSNCPNPGIVGVMEIVKEAEEDWTALDPKAAYYDPKAVKMVGEGKGNPWSLVHVEFREKFERELGLKELREWGRGEGGVLEGMELLRLGRLSVCRVSEKEWEFLMGKAGGRTGREGEKVKEE